jgi:hypothetical protein
MNTRECLATITLGFGAGGPGRGGAGTLGKRNREPVRQAIVFLVEELAAVARSGVNNGDFRDSSLSRVVAECELLLAAIGTGPKPIPDPPRRDIV